MEIKHKEFGGVRVEVMGDSPEQEQKVAEAFKAHLDKLLALRETRLALLPRAKELAELVTQHATLSNNKETEEKIAEALEAIRLFLTTITKEEHDHICAMTGIPRTRYFNFLFKKPLRSLLKK
jgi:acyl-CoA reductase-like NAD-dependent aldehyde dehydrogenase